jgi:hypothetical protein
VSEIAAEEVDDYFAWREVLHNTLQSRYSKEKGGDILSLDV